MATLTIQPGDADSYIREIIPDSKNGSSNLLYVNARTSRRERIVCKFDFSALDASAVITGATFSIYHDINTSADGRTYWAYRLTQTSWVEADVTWDKYDATNNWSTGGAEGDYTITDGASAIVPTTGNWMDFDVKTLVQYARDNVSDVLHLLVRDGTEGTGSTVQARFLSNNNGSNNPKLTITYDIGFASTAPLALSLSLHSPTIVTNVARPDTLTVSLSPLAPVVVQDVNLTISSAQSLVLAQPAPTIAFPIQNVLPSTLALVLAQPVPDPDMTPNTIIGSPVSLVFAQPAPTIFTPSTGDVEATLPVMTLAATGVNGGADAVVATLPMMTLSARVGIKASFSLPIMTLSASGTTTNGATLSRSLPLMTLAATGTVQGRATFARSLPMFTLDISMKPGTLNPLIATLPMFTLEGYGTNGGAPGTSTRSLPLMTLASSGYNTENGTFAKSLPPLELRAFLDNYQNRII